MNKVAVLLLSMIWVVVPEVSTQIIHGIDNQVGKVELGIPVDSSRYELVYELRAYDPIIEDSRDWTRIMQMGDSCRNDRPYAEFRMDSVQWVIHEPYIRFKDFQQLYLGYANPRNGRSGPTYNFDGHKWRDVELIDPKVHTAAYDSTAVQEWELLDGTTRILGLECRQAKCRFRGREWTAWYAPEIPVDGGPWKLRGLPGLILRATTADKEYAMDALAIRKGSGLILLKPANCVEMSRTAMAKKLRDRKEYPWRNVEPGGVGSVIGGDPEADRNKRAFFNPIEKTAD